MKVIKTIGNCCLVFLTVISVCVIIAFVYYHYFVHDTTIGVNNVNDQLAVDIKKDDELTEQEVSKNKAIRGYIIRALAKGNQNTLLVRQITNALVADGLIFSPDISKHLEYLEEAGYIVFTNRAANAYNAYRKDAIIKLTKRGVDLLESTIDDPGVDV